MQRVKKLRLFGDRDASSSFMPECKFTIWRLVSCGAWREGLFNLCEGVWAEQQQLFFSSLDVKARRQSPVLRLKTFPPPWQAAAICQRCNKIELPRRRERLLQLLHGPATFCWRGQTRERRILIKSSPRQAWPSQQAPRHLSSVRKFFRLQWRLGRWGGEGRQGGRLWVENEVI